MVVEEEEVRGGWWPRARRSRVRDAEAEAEAEGVVVGLGRGGGGMVVCVMVEGGGMGGGSCGGGLDLWRGGVVGVRRRIERWKDRHRGGTERVISVEKKEGREDRDRGGRTNRKHPINARSTAGAESNNVKDNSSFKKKKHEWRSPMFSLNSRANQYKKAYRFLGNL